MWIRRTSPEKHPKFRDRLASIYHNETAELAVKAFELSQTLQNTWVLVLADYATKRRIFEIVCLNCRLDGASALFTTRKPFDVLIEGLYSRTNRGDRI